jgi:ubiquinone/menaquinone biosynthesis C-methylase UbiE
MDFFSGHSKIYAEFRPSYPEELFTFLLSHTKNLQRAWDCGTGNGQVAIGLAKFIKHVDATDISQQQLNNAAQHPSITYHLCDAHNTPFTDNSFDLITIGQALHWFDFENFYKEVRRVSKPGATLAVWGYNICRVDPIIDRALENYYKNTIDPYWHPRRKLIDEAYQTIPFPFMEISTPEFEISEEWSLDHFIGYLTSWSATQNFIKEKGENPAEKVRQEIGQHWKDKMKSVRFPVFLRIGIVG